jgi:hypothetical protein
MNGRVYDPVIGRFLSADLFVNHPFNSQSFNRYSYVLNNPLSLTDPTGYADYGGAAGQADAYQDPWYEVVATGQRREPMTAQEMGMAAYQTGLQMALFQAKFVTAATIYLGMGGAASGLDFSAMMGNSTQASTVGNQGRNLNPDGYVFNNPQVPENVQKLHDGIAGELGTADFVFQVTGGDRYIGPDGRIYSATDGSLISASSLTSPHLIERGARAADLRVDGVPNEVFDRVLRTQTDFLPANTIRGYDDGHTHVALPNTPEFSLP